MLATVLSTHLVIPDKVASRPDSQQQQRLCDAYRQLGRQFVGYHRGRLVKITDGELLATFAGPGRAVRCAIELSSAVKQAGADLQVGLHAGEIDIDGHDLDAPTMRAAIHVMNLCQPGEVLVSRVIADIVAGAGLSFAERERQQVTELRALEVLYAARLEETPDRSGGSSTQSAGFRRQPDGADP